MKPIPLTPLQGGGLCIGESALNIADIIVSTTPATSSGVIRTATGSEVSHAMLYLGFGKVIEAVSDGVVQRPLGEALGESRLGVAYRHAQMTPAVASRIVSLAQSKKGNAYDYSGAAGAGIRSNAAICSAVGLIICVAASLGAMNQPSKFFCSELVLEAFSKAGLPVVSVDPGVSTPQHIVDAYSNGTLQYIGHVKV